MTGKEINKTRVFLWRHPEVRGVSDGRVYGHLDVALTRRGQEQLKAIASRMAGRSLGAVYCSDLQRTHLVAEAVAKEQKGRLKPQPLPGLRELNLGIWEGLTYQEISRRFPEELAARYRDLPSFRIAKGESLADLADRAWPVFQQIVKDTPGEEICVISHSGVNRVLLCHILGAPLSHVFRVEQDFACLNVIDVYPDGLAVVKQVNLTLEDPVPREWTA
ncbi:MAG: histidine phosphatase family protein [Deltaproteobacteria bacterium]|nr:histidine phosphatase family protein [Deltaproteobacteria bacterium]